MDWKLKCNRTCQLREANACTLIKCFINIQSRFQHHFRVIQYCVHWILAVVWHAVTSCTLQEISYHVLSNSVKAKLFDKDEQVSRLARWWAFYIAMWAFVPFSTRWAQTSVGKGSIPFEKILYMCISIGAGMVVVVQSLALACTYKSPSWQQPTQHWCWYTCISNIFNRYATFPTLIWVHLVKKCTTALTGV